MKPLSDRHLETSSHYEHYGPEVMTTPQIGPPAREGLVNLVGSVESTCENTKP
jgi:hypothetical protein